MAKTFATKAVLATAMTAALAAWTTQGAQAADGEKEKCFGIAKAGKNDCGVNTLSCAGTAPSDDHPHAFVVVPKGLCDKIAGGSTAPKSE